MLQKIKIMSASTSMTAVQTALTNTNQVSSSSSPSSSSNQTTVIMTSSSYKEKLITRNDKIDMQEIIDGTNKHTKDENKKPYGGRPLRFQCEHCDRRFHAPSHLKRHTLCHSSERPYQCNICKKGFLQAWHLSRHMTTHTGNKPFNCPECSKTFGSRFEMKTHCNYIHRGIKEHKCEECGKLFTLRSNLKVHMRKHTGEKPYKCGICSKSFGQRGHLQYHMRKHAETSITIPRERKLSSIDSGESVNDQKDRYDSGIDVESTCSGRNSTTNLLSDNEEDDEMIDVENHEDVPLSSRIFDHTNPDEIKPFVCDTCSCGFGEINSLISHTRHSHPKKGIITPIFSCAYCQYPFYEIESLNLHYLEKHLNRNYKKEEVILEEKYERRCIYPNEFKNNASDVSINPKCTCESEEMKLLVQEKYLSFLRHYQKMLESQIEFLQMMKCSEEQVTMKN